MITATTHAPNPKDIFVMFFVEVVEKLVRKLFGAKGWGS